MKTLKQKISIVIIITLFTPLFFVSCHRNEQPLPELDTVQVVKEFVYDITKTYYLWEKFIPKSIKISDYNDPHELFEKMYYPTLDHWSFVTDDYTGLQNDLDGIRKAAGFKFRPFLYEEGGTDVYMFVEYVHTDGNAFKAGLKRGDIIIKINGTKLTKNNLRDLISNDVLTLSIAEVQGNEIVDLDKTIEVTKVEQSFSPILKHNIITKNNKKIAYFLFDQFIRQYDQEMTDVMQSFKNDEIDDLVLDLRFNSGGYVSTCALLGSMIPPKENISKKVFLTFQWNEAITSAYKHKKKYKNLFQLDFPESDVNLGLQTLYVLCSDRTASASEAIVNCLRPYMNVVLIGTKTVGKYTAVNVFSDTNKPAKHNWAVFLVTSRIANANGVTDYVDGFTPDFVVKDNYITELGNENEPLFAKAIELITGSTTKKALQELPSSITVLSPLYENRAEQNGLMINDTQLEELK